MSEKKKRATIHADKIIIKANEVIIMNEEDHDRHDHHEHHEHDGGFVGGVEEERRDDDRDRDRDRDDDDRRVRRGFSWI